jgi:hypothetical protein
MMANQDERDASYTKVPSFVNEGQEVLVPRPLGRWVKGVVTVAAGRAARVSSLIHGTPGDALRDGVVLTQTGEFLMEAWYALDEFRIPAEDSI